MGATGILDRSKLEDAYRGFKTSFDMAFARAATITDQIATTIQSESTEEKYDWLSPAPKMREWLGDRRMDELRAYSQTIVNKEWSNGLRIAANDIRDDKLSIVRPRINALADEAAYHQEELLVNLLVGGFTQTCYDGQYFFDTDHSDGGSASQSNKGTTALSTAGAFDAAVQSMLERTDENGEPIRVTPRTLVVGPKLRATALGLLEAEVLASGATNTNFHAVSLVISQRLVGTYDDYWFLIGEGAGGMKPLILQQREPVSFIAQDDLVSEGYFNRKEFRYGAQWAGNVGYGLWQMAFGAIV
jgi:phage major head subunit gpT-like protein